MKQLEYTIVIATRNRPAALRLSIPRMLAQSRPPSQLIVIDSSDDHEATAEAVRESVRSHTKPLDLTIKEGARGLTRQRNAALDLVKHPVVFFPDDDSIWFPDTARIQMEAYEADECNILSAVCGAESKTAPAGFQHEMAKAYKMNFSDKIRQKIVSLRSKIERKAYPDPVLALARRRYPRYNTKDKLPGLDVFPVEYMTGFRMSFRTSVALKNKFEETFKGYCLNEDIDASLAAWRCGIVAATHEAKIYHFKSPEKRSGGWTYGIDAVLNKAFIVAKYTDADDELREYCMKYFKYKCMFYRWAQGDSFGKNRAAGALAAMKMVGQILKSNTNDLRENYEKIRSFLIQNQ